ncbi:imelysin family protein [Chondromyces crocatus]|uniref:Peptidase M75 n=1 Tax=Chondromyces crocatus TaxID=52 RepID=A0A0K1EG94_CHOCO|nr:imelysin family protein [Chondromyces crocatus]AKT39702.1 peptidase M75 [Chondromyces crocatus]
MWTRTNRGLVRTVSALGLGAFLLAGSVRCSSSEVVDNRGPVMQDLARNVMLPTVEALATASTRLAPALGAFCASPDQATLDAAQDAWRALRQPWEHTQAFLFGPSDQLGTANAIDFWPVRTDSVDKAVTSAPDPVTPEHIATLGVATRGMPALEYLLFSPDGGDAAVLTSLGADTQEARHRCSFAAAVATVIETDIAALADAWRPEKGAFVDDVASAGSGSETFPRAQDGISRVVNTAVELLQKVTDGRIGAPSGTRTGGTPQPALSESRFSDNTNTDLIEAARGVEAIYTGSAGGTSGLGLSTLVAERSAELDTAIRNQFTDFVNTIQALPAPLRQAVETDPAAVATALESGRALRRLIAVDLAGTLSVTVTLNDNDGD